VARSRRALTIGHGSATPATFGRPRGKQLAATGNRDGDAGMRAWAVMTTEEADLRPATAGQDRDRAIAQLFSAHYPGLVRLAYLLTSDGALAEELAQESFVVAWRAWERLRSTDEVVGYLRGTVVNLARMSIRRRMLELRHRVTTTDDGVEHDPAGSLDLQRMIARLPMRRRTCIVLRYFLDLSEADTTSVLGVSVGTVKSSTHHALRDLERQLERAGGGDHGAA
jgi:RNA polymerase sigma-70 factor (sigma-E family)